MRLRATILAAASLAGPRWHATTGSPTFGDAAGAAGAAAKWGDLTTGRVDETRAECGSRRPRGARGGGAARLLAALALAVVARRRA